METNTLRQKGQVLVELMLAMLIFVTLLVGFTQVFKIGSDSLKILRFQEVSLEN